MKIPEITERQLRTLQQIKAAILEVPGSNTFTHVVPKKIKDDPLAFEEWKAIQEDVDALMLLGFLVESSETNRDKLAKAEKDWGRKFRAFDLTPKIKAMFLLPTKETQYPIN